MNLARLEVDVMNDEGFRSEPYLCSARYWTIGYGSRWLFGEPVTEETAPVRSDTARIQLRADLYRAILDASELFPRIQVASHARQEVLANMAYQLGYKGLSKFRRMRDAFHLGDYQATADEMVDSRWHVQSGRRAWRLEMIMRSGAYRREER